MLHQLADFLPFLLRGAAFVLLFFVVGLWLTSIVMKDSSIVDVFWGPGCAAVGWVYYLSAPSTPRATLAIALASVWGLRLGAYIGRRNWGAEDARYARLRRHITDQGRDYTMYSLRAVFAYQGAAMVVCTLPLLFAIATPGGAIGPLAWIGAAVSIVGLLTEIIADQQMAAFRAGPRERGEVMDRGLWRYSRHPNYFGEMLVQWGFFLVALDSGPLAALSIVAPALLSYLIMGPMGAALLERRLVKKNPGYGEYIARTSAFVPMPPKRGELPTPPTAHPMS